MHQDSAVSPGPKATSARLDSDQSRRRSLARASAINVSQRTAPTSADRAGAGGKERDTFVNTADTAAMYAPPPRLCLSRTYDLEL